MTLLKGEWCYEVVAIIMHFLRISELKVISTEESFIYVQRFWRLWELQELYTNFKICIVQYIAV